MIRHALTLLSQFVSILIKLFMRRTQLNSTQQETMDAGVILSGSICSNQSTKLIEHYDSIVFPVLLRSAVNQTSWCKSKTYL